MIAAFPFPFQPMAVRTLRQMHFGNSGTVAGTAGARQARLHH